MQLSLRPYVTAGVAIVGASVLVAAPIAPTPPDVKIPMPAESVALAQSSAEVELASVITDLLGAFNTLSVAVGQSIGGGYQLPYPAPPYFAETNGLAGWIGVLPALTLASLQAALDNPQDIPGLASYNIYTLLAQPGALFPPPSPYTPPYPASSYSLFVNALAPIIAALEEVLPGPLSDALAHLSETLGEVIAKALAVLPDPINPYLPPAAAAAANVAEFSTIAAPPPPPPPQPIEDGVNRLTYALVSATVPLLARILTPVLGPLLPPSMAPPELVVTGLLLGLAGPLISGPGGAGAATQDIADALGSRNPAGIVNALIGAPATLLNGVVNGGGFGPDLDPLVGNQSPLPLRAGGLINPGGLLLDPVLNPVGVSLPGSIPTLQQLVGGLLGDLAPNQMVNAKKVVPAGNNLEISGLAGDDQENSDDDDVDTPRRNRPLLNLVRHSLGADEDGASEAGAATGPSGKHRIGTPVRDLINKVVNGGRDKGDDDDNGQADKDDSSDPK